MTFKRLAWFLFTFVFFISSVQASELVVNGDFSITPVPGGGIYGWVSSASSPVYHPESNQTIQPDTTSGYVCVVPGNSSSGYAYSIITQLIRVPRDPLPASIHFAYQYFNEQPLEPNIYLDAHFGSTELMREQAGSGSNPTPTPGWTIMNVPINLGSYSGQNVILRFRSFNGVGAATSYMVLDDVSLDIITATKTNTPTLTPTSTITMSCTISPTATVTPTSTPTYTITSTRSPTYTHTPTWTQTPVLTQTSVISLTPTMTIVFSRTATPHDPLVDLDLTGRLFMAFPNPARDKVTFVLHAQRIADLKIAIYNLAGERVAELQVRIGSGPGQTAVWDCSGIAPGVYVANVFLDGKTLGKQKLAVVK